MNDLSSMLCVAQDATFIKSSLVLLFWIGDMGNLIISPHFTRGYILIFFLIQRDRGILVLICYFRKEVIRAPTVALQYASKDHAPLLLQMEIRLRRVVNYKNVNILER
jgi:hypothetical protein